ncbi:MAG: hypothetical protein KGK09_01005 [Burkholderiales bacterium]|nr:hypothetical protein [Burkholderiales bacterium]
MLAWASASASASASLPAAGEAPGLRFEQVFSDRGEPSALHYQARYTVGGVPHRLEVWRDGQSRLVRRTDDAIETHVTRQPGDADYRMVVLDLRRRIATRIDRDDLYRIGRFTDWFDLAHGLRQPLAAYRLTAAPAPGAAPRAIDACRWYALVQAGQRTQVCWSVQEHLPLLMLDQGGSVLWQVTALARTPVPAAVLEVHDRGFVRNDASQDISGD